jgi:UDP-2,3-diacylglucosamine pyrophosphatase LpxH/transcription termination factor NusB
MTNQQRIVRVINDAKSNVPSAARRLRGGRLTGRDYKKIIFEAAGSSVAHRNNIIHAVVAGRTRLADRAKLIRIAVTTATPKTQKALVYAFREARAEKHLVAALSVLAPEKTAPVVQMYFKTGGTIQPFLEWLAQAGDLLGIQGGGRRTPLKLTTFQKELAMLVRMEGKRLPNSVRSVFDALGLSGRGLGSIFGEITGGLKKWKAAVNSAIAAGKSVGEIVQGAIEASAEGVAHAIPNVIKALVAAGQATKQILQEMWERAQGSFQECILTLLIAGRKIEELLQEGLGLVEEAYKELVENLKVRIGFEAILERAWKVAENVFSGVVGVLRQGVGGVKRIVAWGARKGLEILEGVVQALIKTGSDVFALAALCVKEGWETLRRGVEVIVRITGDIGTVLRALATKGARLGSVLKALRQIGTPFSKLFESAFALGEKFGSKIIRKVVSLGSKVGEILGEAVSAGEDVFTGTLRLLVKSAKRTVGGVIAWSLQQAKNIRDLAFDALVALGHWRKVLDAIVKVGAYAFDTIVDVLETAAKAVGQGVKIAFNYAVKRLETAGATIKDIFRGTWEHARDFFRDCIRALLAAGRKINELLDEGLGLVEEAFKGLVENILKLRKKVGTLVKNLIAWSMEKLDYVMDLILEVIVISLEYFWVLLKVVLKLRPKVLERIASWLVNKALGDNNWFSNKILIPAFNLGKFTLLIIFARAVLFTAMASLLAVALIAAIVFAAIKILWARMDSQHWPEDFEKFKESVRNNLIELPKPDGRAAYVVISDAHKESQGDVVAGLGHFYQNRDLFLRVMNKYFTDPNLDWTVILLGDDEDFWLTRDGPEGNPFFKIPSIISANKTVYDLLSQFHKCGRLIKISGNHDDIWAKSWALGKLEPILPGIKVYDYAVIPEFKGRNVLLMHGHQADPFNCNANRELGKFLTDMAAEPDELLVKVGDFIEKHFGNAGKLADWIIDFMHLGATKFEWEKEKAWLDQKLNYNENEVVNKTAYFNSHVIIGHTHHPRMRKRKEDGPLYMNTATSGCWEDCVWTLELKTVVNKDGNSVQSAFLRQWAAGEEGAAVDYRDPIEDSSALPLS